MKMSEEMAVRLHRMMWSDMQKELGDTPNVDERENYKTRWISKHFPGAMVHHSCFLCEFTQAPYSGAPQCKCCPIKWPNDNCISKGANINYISSPISEILALPARNEDLNVVINPINDDIFGVLAYSRTRNYIAQDLADVSGLDASYPIKMHISQIQEKAIRESNLSKIYGDAKMELAKASGLPAADAVADHIMAIQEKAVEEYFRKTPGAKLATMDVDQAFKQYADEQKAPISEIRSEAKSLGRKERSEEIFKQLSVYSGISENDWAVYDHVEAIKKTVSSEKELGEAREELKNVIGVLNLYRSTLSYESNLPSSAPVAAHIKQIREYAFHDGKIHERERIMDKIGEMLNDKSTGTRKDI